MKNCSYSNYNMQNQNFSNINNNGNRNKNRADRMGHSSCCMDNGFLNRQDFPVAMAYVPWTKFIDLYEPERGLNAGTIFADLDKPFLGRRAFRR